MTSRRTFPIESSPAPGTLRQVVESVVILAISVTLFRAFAAEGYLISTGSMAPSLLGYHKDVECPACHYHFARGVPVDESDSGLNANTQRVDLFTESEYVDRLEQVCRCPNCGQSDIPLAAFPRNEGDQLLVHKNVYDLRDPHRWEVVVFRNPDDPAQPYVKRVVGLPGEVIRIQDGNVYADGVLQRKPLPAQQGIRVPVDDHDHQPEDDEWRPRWRMTRRESGWTDASGVFKFSPPDMASGLDWIEYRHCTRDPGGKAEVPLMALPAPLPPAARGQVTHDGSKNRLSVSGGMTDEVYQTLAALSDEPNFQSAVTALYEKSHFTAITDEYGYNRLDAGERAFVVPDLMLECDVTGHDAGLFVTEMQADGHTFACEIHWHTGEVFLTVDGDSAPIRQGMLPKQDEKKPYHFEMSVMDRQVLLAIDNQSVFLPLQYADDADGSAMANEASPVRFAAAGGNAEVRHLKLYRDVYYTPKNSSEKREFQLGPTEFMVLGDNSPVSVDSRAWANPAIDRSTLIGKPFIVHLPSRQAKLEVGGNTHFIRVPDFSKVRYIR